MNTNRLRPTLLAAAAVAIVAAGVMGLMTFRGETREADKTSVCATADWPLIPAECLEGASLQPVRVVGDLVAAASRQAPGDRIAMQVRFETAFQ